jgi:hypothetical protein
MQWRQAELLDSIAYTPPKYDPFEVFKPSKSFINLKIKELRNKCYEIIKKKNSKDYWPFYSSLEEEHQGYLRLIRRYEAYVQGAEARGGITESDVLRARGRSVAEVYQGQLKKSGSRFTGICPFHSDRRPSLVVYPAGKGYHCFVCQVGGDTIDFVMRFYNLDFIQAIKYINKY